MPIEPSAIGRHPTVAAAFELGDAEKKTDDGQERAEDGRPNDDLRP